METIGSDKPWQICAKKSTVKTEKKSPMKPNNQKRIKRIRASDPKISISGVVGEAAGLWNFASDLQDRYDPSDIKTVHFDKSDVSTSELSDTSRPTTKVDNEAATQVLLKEMKDQLNNMMGAFWTLKSKITELEAGGGGGAASSSDGKKVVAAERECAVNIPRLTEECIRRHSEEGGDHHNCKICSSSSNGAGENVGKVDLGKRKRIKKTRADV